jgi:hypothetical protein
MESARLSSVAVAGGHAYVTAQHRGAQNLKVLEVTDPSKPAFVGEIVLPGPLEPALGVTVQGEVAYVASGSAGLKVVDVSNPRVPVFVGSADTPGQARGVTISDQTAYVADGDHGLQVLDLSNPLAPSIVGAIDTPGNAHDVWAGGGLAYVADGDGGLQVIEVSDPNSPRILAGVLGLGTVIDVEVHAGHAYLACALDGLRILDVSDPARPEFLGGWTTPYPALSVTTDGTSVYVADHVEVHGGCPYWPTSDTYGSLNVLPPQCSNIPDPVELSYLEALPRPSSIVLRWGTTFEMNHLGFRVHRTEDPDTGYSHVGPPLIVGDGTYEYRDVDVVSGRTYYYRLEAVDRSGQSEFFGPISATVPVAAPAPVLAFGLSQSLPNPFGPLTAAQIRFDLPERVRATLRIYDHEGRLVRRLVDEVLGAGHHAAEWNGRAEDGREVGSGVYFYELEAGLFKETRRLVLLK